MLLYAQIRRTNTSNACVLVINVYSILVIVGYIENVTKLNNFFNYLGEIWCMVALITVVGLVTDLLH